MAATLREPFVCSDCGKSYWNRAAHTEECSGQARLVCGKITSTLPVMRCRLDYGHTGDCQGARG